MKIVQRMQPHLKNAYPMQVHIFTSALKNYKFSTRVGTTVDWKKVLKQAGLVYNIKSQKIN